MFQTTAQGPEQVGAEREAAAQKEQLHNSSTPTDTRPGQRRHRSVRARESVKALTCGKYVKTRAGEAGKIRKHSAEVDASQERDKQI